MIDLMARLVAVAALFMVAGCTVAPGQPTTAEPPSVWAIGDSIMVGAEPHIRELVPGIDLDAEPGRSFATGIEVLETKVATGDTPDVLVFALGTNAGASQDQIDEVMNLSPGVEEVIFVNVTVPRDWEESTNAAIADAVARHDNATLVDWNTESRGQDRWFRSDGFHPNETGSRRWANLIVIELKNAA
jgi:lysophospholipase L1-like esterase